MAEGAAAPSAPIWFVQAGGRVWGPYPQARLEAFVAEGRVAARTLLAPAAEGPFHAAAVQPSLRRLFEEAAPEAASGPAEAEPAGLRPLLVWARLAGHAADRFEQGLAAHGPYARVGEGLWLVRARLGPAGLRNALTRKLGSADALMVLEAPLDQAAWFNLDGETDRALRRLWGD